MVLGFTVGIEEGGPVTAIGSVGDDDGLFVGNEVGLREGFLTGDAVGDDEGLLICDKVGPLVKEADGALLGAFVGDIDGPISAMGDLAGEIVGAGGGGAVQSYPRPSPRSGRGPPK